MGSTISRRSALKLLATSGSAVIVAACSGQIAAPASAPTVASGATIAPTAAKPGGTLRIGLAAEPANIDGHIRTPGSDLSYWLAFDRLIDYDDKAQPQPGLAESWRRRSGLTRSIM
jgi:ABC-type transport system substrate-binding protein